MSTDFIDEYNQVLQYATLLPSLNENLQRDNNNGINTSGQNPSIDNNCINNTKTNETTRGKYSNQLQKSPHHTLTNNNSNNLHQHESVTGSELPGSINKHLNNTIQVLD